MRRSNAHWLDDDCWELVFKQLQENRRDFCSVSLVCKSFLAITNKIKTTFNVQELSAHQFARVLRKYPHLKSIEIHRKHYDAIVDLIGLILQSGLELESLKVSFRGIHYGNGLQGLGMSLKSLKTLWLLCPSDDDLIAVTDIFPCIEDLKINGDDFSSVTDNGIEVLAKKLKRLEKITLDDCRAITDQSLKYLASSGLNFTEIRMIGCLKLTESGVGFMLKNSCSMLVSLYLDLWTILSFSNGDNPFTIKNSISYARKLEEIHIWSGAISDEVLCSFANSCPLLRKISFLQIGIEREFTLNGLKSFVAACPCLKYFNPGICWLTDKFMVEISQHLHALTHIDLRGNSELSSGTFFLITERCPLLETIYMNIARLGTSGGLLLCSHKNFEVKHLMLSFSELLDDSTLISFGSICPNIESLRLWDCPLVSEEGLSYIIRSCPKLRFLDISNSNLSNFLGMNDEVRHLKLRTVRAERTKICGATMKSIGMRCPDLEELLIDDCQYVTRDGVEEVVKSCKSIKNISMKGCQFVNNELLAWMVKSRPSLEFITIPDSLKLSEELINFFRRKGCVLTNVYYG